MWALRRASIPLRSQGFRIRTSRACCAKLEIPSSCIEDDKAGVLESPQEAYDRWLYLKRFYHTEHSSSKFSVGRCSFSSQAGAKSSGEEDDLEDGFSELETTSSVQENQDSNVADESDDDLISGPELSDVDVEEPSQNELELSDIETDPIEKKSSRRAQSELFKAIMAAPGLSIHAALDKWLEEGHDLSRAEISLAMINLRKRRMYGRALQLSEWLEAKKQLDFVERDYASRLDLISKVRGLQRAESYIEKIPKSFRGEVIYRTLLANCVAANNVKKAEVVFNKMKDLEFPMTSFSCNQLLLLYKRLDKKKIADVLLLMEKESVKPTLFTYKILIDTKGQSNDIAGMDQIVETMKAEGIEPDINTLAVLARHYASGGLTEKAEALDALQKNDAISVYNIPQYEQKKRKIEKKETEKEEGNDQEENVDKIELQNPATDTWLMKNRKSPWAGKKEGLQSELTEEQKKYAEEYAKKKGEERERGGEKGEILPDKSTFHGKEERDYQGRSWIAPPKDAKANNDHCYIPKRLVHTWSGHTKGVSAIRFFPKHGHLLLSAGMDTKVKIWDVFNSGKCMRTYMGHSKAVRDIWFCNDGSKFLTAGYDKNIKYWDTETGQVISTFSTGKIPYVVRLNPDNDKQNILLAGMSDKKIVQWDMNTGQITQEYDQHLGAVNTITFVDNNRRFVTSSDDKSLRVWEFGIPVVIKYISEPHMHSMPSISLHPSTNYLAAQSLDNQILIYSTRERFQLNKKKRFAGHIVAGYACQVNFSPDGRFVMSGDGEGKCWFWDWKTCRVFRTLKCHEGVCIGCEWHPLEQSKVATCGWDGLIKYWD